jgi:epoxyqueuosine reductase
MSHPPLLSAQQVKTEARRLGFSGCGLAPAAPLEVARAATLRRWVAEGQHAGMDYIPRHLEMRLDPRKLVEGARTVVSVALNYYTEAPLSPQGYTLARYARGKDYHDVMRRKLRELMQALGLSEPTDGRPFCDTAPIDERYWAARCGLGWCGRNGQLILPGAGSYFFLGELVLTRAADAYDAPLPSHCGTCRRCLDACPARALNGDGTLDARRCLSYLTIEHRGDLPAHTGTLMHDSIYGCDRCAEVCPWNRFARPTEEADFAPTEDLQQMTADDWRNLTVERYRQLFKGSAVKRAKYEGLLRNIHALNEEMSS